MTISEAVRLFNGKRAGKGRWKAKCPCHDDRSRDTLKITSDNRGIALFCWAGCDTKDILAAVGLRYRDLFFHSRDLASEALARTRQRERDKRASDLRVGEWILRFAEHGYTLQDRERDLTTVASCGIALSQQPSPRWESILRTHMERIAAADHCRSRGMLPNAN